MRRTPPHRSGAVLIMVAGVSALFASLAVTLLVRQRNSSEESAAFERDVQARIMLIAGCNYVQETSRIGYDKIVDPADPTAPWHREAFGWVDVRQLDSVGEPLTGPNCRGASPLDIVQLYSTDLVECSGLGDLTVPDRPAWPAIGGVARCPMYVWERPPYALRLTAAYNPIVTDHASAAFGKPYLGNPDPMPLITDPGANAAARADYMTGLDNPRTNSVNRAWFRVYRDGKSTFVITCGSGGTQGYASWREVLGVDRQNRNTIASSQFGGDETLFTTLLNDETRLWYRVEWNPAVASPEVHNIKNSWIPPGTAFDHFMSFPMNCSESFRSQSHPKNLGGTFRYIERLRTAPTRF